MGLSGREILAARGNRKPVRLEVPEWGGDVFVKVLSAKAQGEMVETDEGAPLDVPMRVLVECLCDEEGTRLFTTDDIPALLEEDAPVIMRVFAFAAKVNGLTTKELDEAMQSFEQGPEVG